ncbi:MAG TPA: amidohydrolase family protein [Streptosporangiaceae bacterium]|nr:amidohydrolase family protein [Streptosporangiaceae bacterium]
MAAADRPVVIRNVSLIDGTGAAPVPGSALISEGRRITWTGPEAQLPEGAAQAAVDGGGGTVMPGLINCHVHLANDGSPDLFGQAARDSVTIAALRGYKNLQLTLESGVTSVRDCGAASNIAIDLARAVEDGLVTGPRIRAAGRVITMTGGHGHFIGREADGPDGVRGATRAEIKAGAHFIKAMATGGVLTPGVVPTQTALQQDELEQVAREAHNAGRRAACHAIGNGGIKNAIRAGIDSIEHGFYLDDEALQLAIDHGTVLVPTLIAVNQIVNNGGTGAIPDWVVEKAESESGHHRESFGAAVRAGMKIAAGTDAGTPFNPHDYMATEMALMVEYGLAPMDAIVAATRNAAYNLGLDPDVGTLQAGRVADVIVVAGDPAADIGAMKNVRFVMKDGQVARNDLAGRP